MSWRFRLFLLIAIALTMTPVTFMTGCQELPTEKSVSETQAEIPGEAQTTEVRYVGTETLEEVESSLEELEAQGWQLTQDERQQLVDDFRAYNNTTNVSTLVSGSWYPAYGSHFVWSGVDWDLWLEYKWSSSSQRPYHFETPIWGIYWIIQIRYGGHLDSRPWMEGTYQRVTCITGTALYVPYPPPTLRYYLRVVPH